MDYSFWVNRRRTGASLPTYSPTTFVLEEGDETLRQGPTEAIAKSSKLKRGTSGWSSDQVMGPTDLEKREQKKQPVWR